MESDGCTVGDLREIGGVAEIIRLGIYQNPFFCVNVRFKGSRAHMAGTKCVPMAANLSHLM